MTGKGQFERREQGDLLLAERGKGTANATTHGDALLGAETD